MKLSYKLKVAMMDWIERGMEIVAVAAAGDREKLRCLLDNSKDSRPLTYALREIVITSTPQALTLLVVDYPYTALEAAQIAVQFNKTEMAAVVFPYLDLRVKDNMLSDLIASGREEDVPMARCLVKQGADLGQVLERVEFNSAAGAEKLEREKRQIEQKLSTAKSMAAKLKM